MTIRIPGGALDQMRETIRVIGRGIVQGSTYLPIRNLAAAWASMAAPKNYIEQAQSVFDGFLSRWRYVRDPVTRELVTYSPEAIYRLMLAGDGVGVGLGLGAGDCDCATVALGALYHAIGFPVRIATIAKPGSAPSQLMDHVFPEINVPGVGWVTTDPVLHPRGKFGDHPPACRKKIYDLSGNVVGYWGNLKGGNDMKRPYNWQSYPKDYLGGYLGSIGYELPEPYQADHSGLLGAVEYWPGSEPQEWSTVGLAGWGYLSPSMGVIDGTALGGIGVEVDDEQLDPSGYVRTPMIELGGSDYQYVAANGRPYDGMLGLGDDGEVYYYDGLGGWFKRLRRRIRRGFKKIGRGIRKVARGIRKVRKRIQKGIRKVVRRLPGGKMLLKIGGKLRKIAMRVVKPLAKFGRKLAPIAAMIPGYGPAIAAGLRIGGKIAQHMGGAGRGAVQIRRAYGPTAIQPEAFEAREDYSRILH
ncbi:MAG: hypothetical protein PHO89_11580 [Methylacidiphilaceae bacterium]|nr:hypothetical protein [Candidatus Methylacidiphilaceae bacterium]